MKCEVCRLATITYAVYKGMILCQDCWYWVKYEDDVNPEED